MLAITLQTVQLAKLPEVKHLLLFKVTHGTAMGALDIISNNLQVGLHADCCSGDQQQVAAQLLCICLLCILTHFDIAIKHPSATRC